MTKRIKSAYEYSRESLCVLRTQAKGNWYLVRVMDCYDDSGKCQYKWVYGNENEEMVLYNRFLIVELKNSNQDFAFVRWEPSKVIPSNPQVYREIVNRELYEVIKLSGIKTFEQLGDRLAEGWEYDGNAVKMILVVFAKEDEQHCRALLLTRNDFLFKKGRMCLDITEPTYANIYSIKSDMISSLKDEKLRFRCRRYLYRSPVLPQSEGAVMIRPFGLEGVGKVFLVEEVESTVSVNDQSVPMGKLTKVQESSEREITAKRKELAEIEQAIKKMEAKREEAERQTRQAEDEYDQVAGLIEEAQGELREAQGELEKTRAAREELLDRLDEDVVLKVGLRAVGNASRGTAGASTAPSLAAYPARENVSERGDMITAVDDNLRCLGAVVPAASANMAGFARGLVASLSGTNLLAVDTTFAPAVANALAYAMAGVPAKHASIPVDWNDAAALERLLADEPTPVIVLDNVFDTVNEALLFALSRSAVGKVLVLPIGAYANLQLVAGEVWDHVFHVPIEGTVLLPSAEPFTAYRSTQPFHPRHAKADVVMKRIDALRALAKNALPRASFTLPAAIIAANAKGAAEEMAMTGWTLPHMVLRVRSASGDSGATKLADACGVLNAKDLYWPLLRRLNASGGSANGR